MSLKEYQKKRFFSSTSEPKGKVENYSTMSFVIQHHRARKEHYDFRLEYKGVLKSWAVPKGLSLNPKDKRLAVMVEDHPIAYANFEGIIPKGNYGAGTVEIFDNGSYRPIDSFEKGFNKGHLKFVLNGKKLKGGWSLIKTNDNNWLIVKTDDKYANVQLPQKVRNPFSNCNVQLATLSNNIPLGKDWLFEIKYDGYRIVSYFNNGKIKMLTRNNKDFTAKFPSIVKSLTHLNCAAFIVDGEIVAFDNNGKSNFSLLQQNLKLNKNNFSYVIFDLLSINGEDLRALPLITRKEKLERLLTKANSNLIYSNHIINKGKECYNFAKEHKLEGIIAKRADSKYSGERNLDWLKIKCSNRQEFIIGGFTISEKNTILSSLLVGFYDNNKLVYVGKVGSGLSEETKLILRKQFASLIVKSNPFFNYKKDNNVTFLKPKLVAEIQFTELTKDNFLRHPRFIGLRLDKNPKEITLEKL